MYASCIRIRVSHLRACHHKLTVRIDASARWCTVVIRYLMNVKHNTTQVLSLLVGLIQTFEDVTHAYSCLLNQFRFPPSTLNERGGGSYFTMYLGIRLLVVACLVAKRCHHQGLCHSKHIQTRSVQIGD